MKQKQNKHFLREQNKTEQNKTKHLAKQSKPLAKYKNKAVKKNTLQKNTTFRKKNTQNKTTPLFFVRKLLF